MKATNLCRETTGKVLKDRLGGHGNIGHISDQRSWYRVVTKSTVKNEKSLKESGVSNKSANRRILTRGDKSKKYLFRFMIEQ